MLVSVDVNHRANLWESVEDARQGLTELAASADVLFATQDELMLVEPALASRPELVVTRGAKGASATVEGLRYDTQAAPVTSVDPSEVGGAFVMRLPQRDPGRPAPGGPPQARHLGGRLRGRQPQLLAGPPHPRRTPP